MNEKLDTMAAYLKLLGHPIRLQAVLLLLEQERTVSELEQLLHVRQPNLSQHLAVLREADILRSSREAKSVTYTITEGLPLALIAALAAINVTDAQPALAMTDDPPVAQPTAITTPQNSGDELMFATKRFPTERD